jgi:AAA domain-containing protein
MPSELIKGILHQGCKMALGGGSKSFKTWCLLQLGISIAAGRQWLGFGTTQGPVLYCNFELLAFAIEQRTREICEAMSLKEAPEALTLWNLRGHAADAATILPMISREAKRLGFVFIVLDPLYKLLGSRDENSSRDMTDLMNSVERLTVETGAAVAFGNHYSKGNQAAKESMDCISGSGVFARDPDSIITMTRHEEDDAFAVEMTLRNHPPQKPFVVRRRHPLMMIDGQLDPAKLRKPLGRKPDYKPEEALACLGANMKTADWQQACLEEGITRATFFRLKRQLSDQGGVKKSEMDGTWMKIHELASTSLKSIKRGYETY